MDDDQVIVRPTHPSRKAVDLQPNAGIHLAVVLDYVTRCTEMFWESGTMHIAFDWLWAQSLRTEVASFLVIVSAPAWFPHMVL
jgi:hypothetical protein